MTDSTPFPGMPASAPRPSADPSAFPDVPGYHLLGILGEGGMGLVYKAFEVTTGRSIALKIIARQVLLHPEAVGRFNREAEVASQLDHPNIVRLYGAGHTDQLHYLAMEYIDGLDLHRLVAQTGHLGMLQAIDYTRQAAAGLSYAHARNILHRDIKPGNLMVTRGEPVIKLLDLGLARQVQPGSAAQDLLVTQDGVFVGTADFVAPEQAIDSRSADPRSDLYSLGCTLYFLLTGAVPFPGGQLVDKLEWHRYKKPIPVEVLRPEVPPEVTAVVQKLMAKRPEDRYPSATALITALDEISFVLSGMTPGDLHTPPRPVYETPDGASWPLLPAAPWSGEPIGECACWPGHGAPVLGVAFTPNGQRLYSAGGDGTVRGWDVATGQEVQCLAACRHGLTAMSLGPSGKRLLTSDADGRVRLWDLETGQKIRTWEDLAPAVPALAFAGNGRYALTGTSEGVIHLWEVGTGAELRRFSGHAEPISAVAFAPDASRVLSGCAGGILKTWDVLSGLEFKKYADWLGGGHRKGVITAVAFSPHGRRMLTAGTDRQVILWEAKSGRRLARFEGHKAAVFAVAFAPDGRHFLSAGADRALRLWDLHTCHEAICFTGHTDKVLCAALSPDGRLAASGSLDGTVRLWRLPD